MSTTIYQCFECTKLFDKRGRYTQHLKIHSKPFSCEKCPKYFPQRPDLMRHIHSRHRVGQLRFPCTFPRCSHKAKRKDNLRQHVKRVHGNQEEAIGEAMANQTAVDTDQAETRSNTPELAIHVQAVSPDEPWILSSTAILEAASFGNNSLLNLAHAAGLDLTKVKGDDGSSPLHCAARAGHSKTVLLLLEIHVSLEEINNKGRTPLHEAILSRDPETIRACLQPEVYLNAIDTSGTSAFQYMMQGPSNVFDVLIEHLNFKFKVARINEGQRPALIQAARFGCIQVIEALLLHPCIDINKRDKKGLNALHTAARYGHKKIVERLLQQDEAAINSRVGIYEQGQTALALAASYGHKKVVQTLLSFERLNMKSPDELHSGAHTAIYRGFPATALLILEDPRHSFHHLPEIHKNSQFSFCFKYAIEKNYAKIVNLLLRISGGQRKPWVRLDAAIEAGNQKLVEFFLENKEVETQALRKGHAPIEKAARCGNTEATKILLQHRHLDPNWQSWSRETALYSALSEPHTEIAKLLLEDERVDVNIICKPWDSSSWEFKPYTPLDVAIKKDQKEMIDILLSRGALRSSEIQSTHQK